MAPVDGITLEALAKDLGVEALKPAGASGYGAISVPTGMPLGHFLAELRSSGLVKAAAPNGLLRSAGDAISSAQASQAVADASEAV